MVVHFLAFFSVCVLGFSFLEGGRKEGMTKTVRSGLELSLGGREIEQRNTLSFLENIFLFRWLLGVSESKVLAF